MSVQNQIAEPILQATEVPVTVKTKSGKRITAIRKATHQINPKTGKSTIVRGSLKYVTPSGEEIPAGDIESFDCCGGNSTAPVDADKWFSSPNGGPIYLRDGVFYNPNGTPYTGETDSYDPSPTASGSVTNSNTYNNTYNWDGETAGGYIPTAQVEDGFLSDPAVPNTYVPVQVVRSVSGTAAPTYKFFRNGQQIQQPQGSTFVPQLPPPTYRMSEQQITDGKTSVTPTDLPISGYSAAWNVMLPSEEGTEGVVATDDAIHSTSGSQALNSEAPMGTVIPPVVSVSGDAYAEIAYRLRVSPLVASNFQTPATPAPEGPGTSATDLDPEGP